MYTQEYLDKLDELIADESFTEAAVKATTTQELKQAFENHGVEAEDEMIQAMFDKLRSMEAGDELSIDDLEMVAGGRINWSRVGYSVASAVIVTASLATMNPVVIGVGVATAVGLTAKGAKKDLGK